MIPPEPKVIITGTGRAGTTLLVQVLTELGLDTGFARDVEVDPVVHAGLEADLTDPNGPRIVKSPFLSWRLAGFLETGAVAVEHVIVPIRDLDVAAASRVRNTRYGTKLRTQGGLVRTTRATNQREALAVLEYELFFTIARFDLPVTLLMFPRFAEDWEYSYRKLSFLDPTIPPEQWQAAFAKLFRPTWLHETPLSRGERALAAAGTVYQRGVLRPLRGARKLLRGT